MKNLQKPSSESIQSMFDGLASRYDLFNHLTGMGLASRWRAITLEPVQPGMKILDLGCGTGDLAIAAIQKMGNQGEVVALDFSKNMLGFAQQRAKKLGYNGSTRIRWIQGRAEDLPIESEPYDAVVSGFVLRNLVENIDVILKKVHQSLKKGGFVRFLDITQPQNVVTRILWTTYMNTVVALYGKVLFGKDYPILYLTESAKRFFCARDFAKKLGQIGFTSIQTKSFMLGAVTLYTAERPF